MGGGAVELLHGDAEFALGHVGLAGLYRLDHLADAGLQLALDGTIFLARSRL